jgi:fluoride exporter
MLIACLLLGGAIGAPARYLLDGIVADRARGVFPWGTFVINVSGALVLGVVTGLGLYHGLGGLPKVAIGTGFCGAYTTFSTFSYETVRLLEDGSVRLAAGNAIGSVVAGLAAAALGLGLTAAL